MHNQMRIVWHVIVNTWHSVCCFLVRRMEPRTLVSTDKHPPWSTAPGPCWLLANILCEHLLASQMLLAGVISVAGLRASAWASHFDVAEVLLCKSFPRYSEPCNCCSCPHQQAARHRAEPQPSARLPSRHSEDAACAQRCAKWFKCANENLRGMGSPRVPSSAKTHLSVNVCMQSTPAVPSLQAIRLHEWSFPVSHHHS